MSSHTELHIIEPTLRDQTGHCYSLVNDLSSTENYPVHFHIWMDHHAGNLFACTTRITQHLYFSRRLRRGQALLLYRKLLSENKPFFISTATSTDLLLLRWAASLQNRTDLLHSNGVKLYIHWIYRSSKRAERLRKTAKHYPELPLACPTESVQTILQESGFRNVRLIPYPASKAHYAAKLPAFEKLLYGGAARIDKGFPMMVNIIERLDRTHSSIPVTIQCSATHKGKHSPEILKQLERLDSIHYAHLHKLTDTLSKTDYTDIFPGSVVLQPYRAADFTDRVSGVTLDALRNGAPVIAPANTWMSRMIERFQAGKTIDSPENIEAWITAIEAVIDKWDQYAQNAATAGRVIEKEHAPDQLVTWLLNKST